MLYDREKLKERQVLHEATTAGGAEHVEVDKLAER
jgi:hypothetical protein